MRAFLFYLIGAATVAATFVAITRRVLVNAVVYLVISFLGTALLFLLLGAPLPAMFEVIIYAGAIMVLFLFALMTLAPASPAAGGEGRAAGRESPIAWLQAAVLAAVSLAAAVVLLGSASLSRMPLRPSTASPPAFGSLIFGSWWPAAQIIAMLLLAALVGALFLGKEERGGIHPAGGHEGEGTHPSPPPEVEEP